MMCPESGSLYAALEVTEDMKNYRTWCPTCLAVLPWYHEQSPVWLIRLRKLWALATFRFRIRVEYYHNRWLFALAFLLALPLMGQQPAAHSFWDAQNVAGVAAMSGAAVADVRQTCSFMSTYSNFHEQPFPIGSPLKSCAGVMFYVSASKLASFAGMKAAHEARHHRMERWIPWVNVAGNVGAVIAGKIDSRRGIRFTVGRR